MNCSSRVFLMTFLLALICRSASADIRWEPEEALTTHPVDFDYYWGPSIAAGQDEVVVAWAFSEEIYIKRWNGTWGPDERVTFNAGWSLYPAVAVGDTGDIFLSWIDDRAVAYFPDLYAARWNGAWGPAERLTLYQSQSHALALDRTGACHLVYDFSYQATPGIDLAYRKWDGAWSVPLDLSTAGGYQTLPDIAAGPNSQLHVVWKDCRVSPCQVYYRRWNGTAWDTERLLSSAPLGVDYPKVAADSFGKTHVVWVNRLSPQSSDSRIFYNRREGDTWTGPTLISNNQKYVTFPDVAVDQSGNVHVVWEEGGPAPIYGANILYRRQEAGQWLPQEQLTVDDGIYSSAPAIACDSTGKVHVVWYDEVDYLLHYRRGVPYSASVAPSPPVSGKLTATLSPNPFAGSVAIDVTGSMMPMTFALYDSGGRLVRTIRETSAAHPSRMVWDGKDARGAPVPAGVYVYRITSGITSTTGLLVRVR